MGEGDRNRPQRRRTGRGYGELGADVIIPFTLGTQHPSGARDYEDALKEVFSTGIDIVVDYLWGESAKTAVMAIAKTVEDTPVRFVHVGSASGEGDIDKLPGAALRSAPIMLMGSGVGESNPDPPCCSRSATSFQQFSQQA